MKAIFFIPKDTISTIGNFLNKIRGGGGGEGEEKVTACLKMEKKNVPNA